MSNPSVTHFTLESPDFPCTDLQIRELHAKEQISRLFEVELLVVVPESSALDVNAILGAGATVVASASGEEKRRIHGIVAEAIDLLDSEPGTRSYRLRLVPRAFRMTLVRTQEAFVNLPIQKILEQKLGLVGLDDTRFLLNDEYEPREFVTQYDETDLDFVSRLAENLGWSYAFDHSSDRDRLVFTDRSGSLGTAVPPVEATFRGRGTETGVFRLELATRLVPSTYVVSDYNYLTPRVDLAKAHELPNGYAGGVVEFGTNHRTPEEGALFARVRAEETAGQHAVYRGEADLCTLAAGATLKLLHHPRLGDVELLITSVEHHASQVVMGFGGEGGAPGYRATFTAIPASVPHRPARSTPKPKIQGLMTGIVETPAGVKQRSPWIDEHGRYLVRLLFDTSASGRPTPSLPIRMVQANAGAGYGTHFPLRPGTEVAVGFVGGDPDRPIIVGAAANALTPSPVVDRDAVFHRVTTSSGISMELNDGT